MLDGECGCMSCARRERTADASPLPASGQLDIEKESKERYTKDRTMEYGAVSSA